MDSIFNITIPGFIFFLLIVCVGYMAVGDLSTKTKKGSLERLIKYILWGIGINFIFLLFFSRSKRFLNLVYQYLDFSGTESIYIINMKVVIFSLGYFLLLTTAVWGIKKIIKKLTY